MGHKQLFLIVLGVIVVGMAIATGVKIFAGTSVSANKDAILNDLQNISQYAYQYRLRPGEFAGGEQSYIGLTLPPNLAANDNAAYAVSVQVGSVTITATSKYGYGTVTAVVDSTGRIGSHVFAGDFN
jgi:hypothetical protein